MQISRNTSCPFLFRLAYVSNPLVILFFPICSTWKSVYVTQEGKHVVTIRSRGIRTVHRSSHPYLIVHKYPLYPSFKYASVPYQTQSSLAQKQHASFQIALPGLRYSSGSRRTLPKPSTSKYLSQQTNYEDVAPLPLVLG